MIGSTNERRRAIIVSASSDIGAALCHRWLARGWSLCGTYRTRSTTVDELERAGVTMVPCDISDPAAVGAACAGFRAFLEEWDYLVLCPGTTDPVGPFAACEFDEWERSVQVNFTSQLRLVHGLLPARRQGVKHGPCVLFFAGGGSNSAPVNYSAYTVAKIALTKMCELLDAEMPDTRFVILGPGWVKTKIHEATLRAGSRAGANYQRTLDKLAGNECTPMNEVLDCCDWLVQSPRSAIGGRNFSVVYDPWDSRELENKLVAEPHLYKLRRFGNDWLRRDQPLAGRRIMP
jgi:NAD(P)-dependent dehydrogenase (short-subunit alcohol dehydrogenase family)